MNDLEIYIAIAIMTIVNYFTRVLPFLFFKNKDLPPYLVFIEQKFPAIIMTILVVYSIKNVDFVNELYGIREILAIFCTALLHIYLKNYLISIFLGTIFYMFLVQF